MIPKSQANDHHDVLICQKLKSYQNNIVPHIIIIINCVHSVNHLDYLVYLNLYFVIAIYESIVLSIVVNLDVYILR